MNARLALPAIAAALLSVAAVPSPATAGVAAPGAAWGSCADFSLPSGAALSGPTALDCAWVNVPLDAARPAGATLRLALVRRPARDPAHRLGTVFVNPGGPGGSGVD